MPKLTIDLVPKTCWYANVRSNVTVDKWYNIRKKCAEKAGHVCEVCGDVGTNQGYGHKVECHEVWEYNKGIQKLVGLVSLCPLCHKAKHIGLAELNGEYMLVLNHIQKVNKMSLKQASEFVAEAFQLWDEQSKYDWELDITYLDTYLNQNNYNDFLSQFKG